AALQERPEAINCLSMHDAINILASAVPHGLVLFQVPVARVPVSGNEANFLEDRFTDEGVQRVSVSVCNDARNDIAFALCGPNDGFLAFAAGSFGALIPMAGPGLFRRSGFVQPKNCRSLAARCWGEGD